MPITIEILKSFGTGLGLIVAALLTLVVLFFVMRGLGWLFRYLTPNMKITFKNIPGWVESAFWLLLFCMFVTMMGYDIRHGS